MAENLITKDLQKLDPGSELVRLFELEYASGQWFYFTTGLDDDLGTLEFRDYSNNAQINTYSAIVAKLEGFDIKSEGAIARPTITIGNASGTLSTAVGTIDYQDFLGFKLVIRTTLKKYLYGESADASPPVEFPRALYYMDRIKARNKTTVQIECVAPFDLGDTRIPARNVLPDRCPFLYKGASRDLDIKKRGQSGCYWHTESKFFNGSGTEYIVYANVDDEYVVPSSLTFTTYSSGSVTKDAYYKTTSTATRYSANGSASSQTVNNYWQAVATNSSPGTPTDTNTAFKRVRVFAAYSHGTEYFTYSDDRYNDYVTFTDNVSTSAVSGKLQLWKAKAPSKSISPTLGSEYWGLGDNCSKRLDGCKLRYGFVPQDAANASTTGSATTDTSKVLPFGGFPASKAFS